MLDTHVLLWLDADDRRLGAATNRVLDRAWEEQELSVSAISFWEVTLLVMKQRLALGSSPRSWRRDMLKNGLQELAFDGQVGVDAAELEGFHADPADRIIVATALARDATVITADERILGWPGPLRRLDART
jgi:PIN domain nuclease of toxin-antitoxin system